MTENIALIVNPTKVDIDDFRAEVLATVGSMDNSPTVTFYETSADDPGQGIAKRALREGPDLVIAAGGDGTVRAVADGLIHSEDTADFGIIPLGTGNILARNLDIPLGDIGKAFQQAVVGQTHALDLGCITYVAGGESEDAVFTVISGFGIDAQIMDNVDDDVKEKAGWLAYVTAAKDAVTETDQITFDLSIDGGTRREVMAHTVMIGNCGKLQGGLAILPDATPFDGKLDLLVVEGGSLAAWADTVKTFVWDKGIKKIFTDAEEEDGISDHTLVTQMRKLSIHFPTPQVIELDGDPVANVDEFSVEVLPRALSLRY